MKPDVSHGRIGFSWEHSWGYEVDAKAELHAAAAVRLTMLNCVVRGLLLTTRTSAQQATSSLIRHRKPLAPLGKAEGLCER